MGAVHTQQISNNAGHITPPWLWSLGIEFEICRAQQQICQAFPRSMVSGLKGLDGGEGKLSTRTPGFTIQMALAAAPIFELVTSPLSGGHSWA